VVDPAGLILEDSGFQEVVVWDPDAMDRRYVNPGVGANTDGYILGSDEDNATEVQDLSHDDLITTPARIAAYSLTSKKWGMVDVDLVEPIVWQDNAWGVLQMETDRKRLVRGVIESHRVSSSSFDDFIPRKGRGLVFLLHGPPGYGKAMTAGMY
jgi:hypothetical protein